MGNLEYNSSHPAIEIDDDTLAHVKILIATKLRRQESFMMTWLPREPGAGRLSAWMHPSIPLVVEFDVEPPPQVVPERLAQMMEQLNARGELVLS